MDQIETEVRRANGEAVGGLLIGRREEGGLWIERVLVCRNTASDRVTRYGVDPAVLANVSRTLEPTDYGILGVFFGGALAEGTEGFAPGALVWRLGPRDLEETSPAAPAGVVRLEVLDEPNPRALICPE